MQKGEVLEVQKAFEEEKVERMEMNSKMADTELTQEKIQKKKKKHSNSCKGKKKLQRRSMKKVKEQEKKAKNMSCIYSDNMNKSPSDAKVQETEQHFLVLPLFPPLIHFLFSSSPLLSPIPAHFQPHLPFSPTPP